MDAYGQLIAALYDSFATGLEGDVDFYVTESLKSGSPVLELGCGTGRITFPVAEAGVKIAGLDQSTSMLEVAREKLNSLAPEVQSRVTLVEGDMKNFSFDRQFHLVMIPYRAFLHLMTVEDQKNALACIHDHLLEDGRLIFNIFDPRMDIIAEHLSPLGSAMKKGSELTHPDTGRRVVVWDTRQFDPENQTFEWYIVFEELDADGMVVSKHYNPLKIRYSYRYEVQHLLELCCYEVVALFGDFNYHPFSYGGEQIWVACKQ